MIDHDQSSNDFSNFLRDTNQFFKEFNRCNPGAVVEDKDRLGLCVAFLLDKISDSLEEIKNAIIHKTEDE